jgi:GNAT superfamily N-acetyltransferase
MTVHDLVLREAGVSDVEDLARIRAAEWGDEEFWRDRITRYMTGEHHPQQALAPRVVIAAWEKGRLVGFIAGHLTQRYECDGELQWLNVFSERRGSGIAAELLHALAAWFAKEGAMRICVNVDPANARARAFYAKHGALELNPHWMVWEKIHEPVRVRRARP